jgi:hypothetical protein
MADVLANFAYSTVAVAPSPATSGTGLSVAAGDGALFPAAPFNVTVWPSGAQPTAANAEIVRVTAVAADAFTIARAREGTSARTITVGDQVAATVTARTFDAVDVDMTPNADVIVRDGYSLVVCRPFTAGPGVTVVVVGAGILMVVG